MWLDLVDNSDFVGMDFNSMDQQSKEFTFCHEIQFLEPVGYLPGKVLEVTDEQLQFVLGGAVALAVGQGFLFSIQPVPDTLNSRLEYAFSLGK